MQNRYLFNDNNINQLIKLIYEQKYLLLFLDYDGTLAPFQPIPARARPFPGIEDIITDLKKKENIIISIISGRKLDNLTDMINIPDLNYAGNHGLKIRFRNGEGFNWLEGKDNLNIKKIAVLKKKLKENFTDKNSINFEDKGCGFCFHLSEEKNQKLEKYLEEKIADSCFEVLPGRKIIEVRPAGWNKGKAVESIIKRIKKTNNIKNYFTLYIGDDSTDEDAFQILKNGAGIYVKNEADLNSSADYYLNNPEDVYEFLEILKDRTS